MVRRLVVLSAAVFLLLALALPGSALAAKQWNAKNNAGSATTAKGARSAGGPRMLAYNASPDFVRRPATVVPFGNGAAISTIIGRLTKSRGNAIHWRMWNNSAARGRGTMWVNDGVPSIAGGTWSGSAATLYAHRVVNGRYTRLTLSGHVNGSARTWKLRLVKQGYKYDGKSVFAWRQFVRVPSWRDFPSSYTGDDWFEGLTAMQTAIEEGFAKRALIADVEFVNGLDGTPASQRPKAGSQVETGTIVHIHIPVVD